MAAMCRAALAGNLDEARRINARLMPLHTGLFVEPNPIPVKWALNAMGRIEPGIRLPLTALEARFRDTVRAALRESGIS
jgi:4-hydroxy-tetrahydrodipicolinate synthase